MGIVLKKVRKALDFLGFSYFIIDFYDDFSL